MSRLVLPKNQAIQKAKGGSDSSGKDSLQDYLERVAKYVPAEIIAVYSLFLGVITLTTGDKYQWLSLIAFTFCAVLTPFYLKKFARPGDKILTHQVIAFFAFLVWAYAFSANEGYFSATKGIGWYDPTIAFFSLIGFSFLTGFLIPKK